MSRRAILRLLLALLAFHSAAEAAHSPVAEVVGTEQYLLIAQQDNYRFAEANVEAGQCPRVMESPKSEPIPYRFVGVHLVRDPDGIHAPRVLTVTEDSLTYNIKITDLHMSNGFEKNSGKREENIGSRESIYREDGARGKAKRNLARSMFDTTRHMLYLDFSAPPFYDIEQIYLHGIFSDRFDKLHIAKYTGHAVNGLFDWVEDPYTDAVYYKERINGHVEMFQAKIKDVVPIITGKMAGRRIENSLLSGELQGVSNGVFYETSVRDVNETHQTLSSTLTTLDSEWSITCNAETIYSVVPKTNKLLIIRANDYCMLRDGKNYNKESCENEQADYLARNNPSETDSNVNAMMWLIVFCVVLILLVILQCVYIFWLRSSFVSADEASHHQDQETEASIFIAKQRSFPASFHEPGLLDVSVDKWN